MGAVPGTGNDLVVEIFERCGEVRDLIAKEHAAQALFTAEGDGGNAELLSVCGDVPGGVIRHCLLECPERS